MAFKEGIKLSEPSFKKNNKQTKKKKPLKNTSGRESEGGLRGSQPLLF